MVDTRKLLPKNSHFLIDIKKLYSRERPIKVGNLFDSRQLHHQQNLFVSDSRLVLKCYKF